MEIKVELEFFYIILSNMSCKSQFMYCFVTWRLSYFCMLDSVLAAELLLELLKTYSQLQFRLSFDIIPVDEKVNKHNPVSLAPNDLAPHLL